MWKEVDFLDYKVGVNISKQNPNFFRGKPCSSLQQRASYIHVDLKRIYSLDRFLIVCVCTLCMFAENSQN